jgi:hypothetical protein
MLRDKLLQWIIDRIDAFDACLEGVRRWLWARHSTNAGRPPLEHQRPYA